MRRLIGVLAVAALLTPAAAAHAASVVRVTIGRAASDAPLLERLGFDVRDRSTTVAMHLIRRLLLGAGD